MSMGYFTTGEQTSGLFTSVALPPGTLFSTWFFMRRAVACDVLPDLLWMSILFKNKAKTLSLLSSSTTVYQSEFQCESKQADPADVSVQKIPWSWGCPEPSWRCLLHAGCHSCLVNRSPPCKHHQWSPPVETKAELTTCRHSKLHIWLKAERFLSDPLFYDQTFLPWTAGLISLRLLTPFWYMSVHNCTQHSS